MFSKLFSLSFGVLTILLCMAGSAFASEGAGIVKYVNAPNRTKNWNESIFYFNDATKHIQNAIDEVFKSGGGRVVVGRGFYPVKGLRLRSHVTLYLKSGAVLQASRNSEDFDILGKDTVEPISQEEYKIGRSRVWTPPRGADEWKKPRRHLSDPYSPWNDAIIRIHSATNVAIIGEKGSIIDGANGFNPKGCEGYRGVHGITAFFSTNIVMRGFTIQHTGNWAMLLRYCGDIVCERVTALGGHDGFHPRGCDNIRVEDCFFHTGDDSIAGFDIRNMVVRGCDLSSACSAFRLGGRDILIENCHVHGPCKYAFRGSIPYVAKKDGLWDPEIIPGRHSTATFFLYLADHSMPVRHQPGNIVVRNCKVENVARLIRYNYGGETWQHARPLEDIRFKGIEASGMWLPLALNGGDVGSGDIPLKFSMVDCKLGFARPQSEVFSTSNVETLALTNVTISGVKAPLVRTWGGNPDLKIEGVQGVPSKIAKGEGKFQCAWR